MKTIEVSVDFIYNTVIKGATKVKEEMYLLTFPEMGTQYVTYADYKYGDLVIGEVCTLDEFGHHSYFAVYDGNYIVCTIFVDYDNVFGTEVKHLAFSHYEMHKKMCQLVEEGVEEYGTRLV